MISVAHGRPAMISQDLSSNIIHTQPHAPSQPNADDQLPYDVFIARVLELCEITHHSAQRHFSPPRSQNPNADCASVLEPSTIEEKLALIIQIDGCLRRWEYNLPPQLKYGISEHPQDEISTRQATVLYCR